MITRKTSVRVIRSVLGMDITPTLFPAAPDASGCAEAVAAYNLLADVSPDRAVIARSTADVQSAVRSAREHGLRVSVLSTGHAAHSAPSFDGTFLIRTAFDQPVTIDADARTATIPAGTRWRTVVQAAAAHGLVAPHGSSGDVGAIGYLLGGGASFYGRFLGVAANSVLSITLVDAEGEVRTASAEEDPELFWALRGGGGGFGIVTELTIRLQPAWRVLTGITFWDAADAAALARAWHAWTRTAPREISTSFRILNLPPLPGVPEVLTGRTVVAVDGAALVATADDLQDRASDVDALLEPLRAIATPLLDDWAPREAPALLLTHLDPPEPLPFVADHMLLAGLADVDLDALVALTGAGSGSTLTIVELRQLGGAFAQPPRAGGAFDRTHAEVALLEIGVVVPEVLPAEQQHATMRRVRTALAARDTRFTLPTFVESTTQPRRTFDAVTRDAVAGVRDRLDPHRVFVSREYPR